MKQYDKLAEITLDDPMSQHRMWSKIEGGPFIVTTIEELREVFDKGYVRGCEEYESKTGILPLIAGTSTNFTIYLQSKGISI